jgi:hypothetical protein
MPVCMGMGRAVAELVYDKKDACDQGYASHLSPKRFFTEKRVRGGAAVGEDASSSSLSSCAQSSAVIGRLAEAKESFSEEKVRRLVFVWLRDSCLLTPSQLPFAPLPL